METSIGPDEGTSSTNESSVPSSIPSVRKFKETPIDGLDSKAQIYFNLKPHHLTSVTYINFLTILL